MFEPLEKAHDPDASVDDMTDDEFADILGPSWAAMTGRRIEDLEIEWTTGEQGGTDHAA